MRSDGNVVIFVYIFLNYKSKNIYKIIFLGINNTNQKKYTNKHISVDLNNKIVRDIQIW